MNPQMLCDVTNTPCLGYLIVSGRSAGVFSRKATILTGGQRVAGSNPIIPTNVCWPDQSFPARPVLRVATRTSHEWDAQPLPPDHRDSSHARSIFIAASAVFWWNL